ncbi:MAG: YdcF family protein [Actinobacteria bacterium]|nr:YdcF family protein [Actinomycetota bacterium]
MVRRATPARRIVRVGGVAALLALCAASARFIVWPADDEPGRADAVVVLAGGAGERLREGQRLVERGVAPVLVLSHGTDCNAHSGHEVICFTPQPDRTQGEARAASRIAERRGWRTLVVVTSTYHVSRTRMLFERCFDGEVRAVGARPDSPGGLPSARNLTREWLGFGHAFLVERGC